MITELLSVHDIRLFAAALTVSLVFVPPILCSLPRHPNARDWTAIARTACAGLLLGGAVWITFLLSLRCFFPFLIASIPWSSIALSVGLASAGACAALAISVFGDPGSRNTVLS